MSAIERLIIWGAGELGSRVGYLWRQAGGPVIGFTQTNKRHAELRSAGIKPKLGSPRDLLRPGDGLLFSLPGHASQRQSVQFLAAISPPARAVFISSTGFYGLPAGVVNERTPAGEGNRPAAIEAAEQDFFNWAGDSGVIIRLGGLYGPGRGPFAALARRGTARFGPPNKTLPLIHSDDAAAAIVAAFMHPSPQPVYLAVIPPCPTRREFYTAACKQLDLSPPAFDELLPYPPVTFDVRLLQRDLLPDPGHPDWRESLSVLSGQPTINQPGRQGL